MLCFRVIFWGVAFIVWLIPALFFFSIVGRISGIRPGPPVGASEKAFGWVGIVILGGIMLAICGGAGLIDWTVATFAQRAENGDFANFQPHQQPFNQQPFNQPLVQQTPMPKPIRLEWNDDKMEATYLSDMQEFNPRVGWGAFGKKGKLGYLVQHGDQVKVNNQPYANALSMHPPSFGESSVKYRLNRAFKLFRADAALADSDPNQRPQSLARFQVLGDNQLLWASQPLGTNNTLLQCRLSVEDVDVLELRIHCPGHNGNVRGVWLDPYVLK